VGALVTGSAFVLNYKQLQFSGSGPKTAVTGGDTAWYDPVPNRAAKRVVGVFSYDPYFSHSEAIWGTLFDVK
jgi:hypothetical protein